LFERLGRFVVAHPWWVIAAWIVAVAIVVPLSPSLGSVSSSDQTSFLPGSYESVRAEKLVERSFPRDRGSSALFVVERADGRRLTGTDRKEISSFAAKLRAACIPGVAGVVSDPRLAAPNGKAELVQVAFRGSSDQPLVQQAVGKLRDRAGAVLQGSDLRSGLTGDAAIQADNAHSFSSAGQVVFIATIGLILIMLGAVFRSPIAAAFPILSIALVYLLATRLLALLASIAGFRLDDSTTALLIVLLFGVGTDYILFLLFRYRERLGKGDESGAAIAHSVHRVGHAIASSGLVVMAAMLALVLSQLGSFRNMAPGFLLGIGLMLLASLTLIPALLALLGPRVFWPSRRWRKARRGLIYRRLGRLIARRPALAALVSGALLVSLASGVFFFRSSYDLVSAMPSNTPSARALKMLDGAFPAGTLNPTQVFVTGRKPLSRSDIEPIAKQISAIKGVGSVFPGGLSSDGRTIELDVSLNADPSSNSAIALVSGPLRAITRAAAIGGKKVLIGGETMASVDIRSATNRDYTVVYPFAALLIVLILAVLLRSVIAPIYLLLGVGLGYTATLGASVHVFQSMQGQSGLLFMMPILVYLFVVAVGTDYNILLTTRLREEIMAGAKPREAAALAIEHSGPTVAAAGAILAGTFGSLMLTGVNLLSQIGFAVAAGIVLVAIVMASVFVPSVATLLGRFVWWPGHRPRWGRPRLSTGTK
jgi:RND superfamily putative drug exporter